jgi:DNA-binding protein HU-beta
LTRPIVGTKKFDKIPSRRVSAATFRVHRDVGVSTATVMHGARSGTCISTSDVVRWMNTELRFRESKEIAMTKADLLAAVAAKTNVSSAEADRVIQAFVDLVVESASKGDKVSWPGFGSFSTSKRQARTGRNPRTGEPVQIAASTTMKFSPSSTLKAALNPNR